MKHSTLLTLLLWAALITLGMMIGYGIAASYHSAPPFTPKTQNTQMVGV